MPYWNKSKLLFLIEFECFFLFQMLLEFLDDIYIEILGYPRQKLSDSFLFSFNYCEIFPLPSVRSIITRNTNILRSWTLRCIITNLLIVNLSLSFFFENSNQSAKVYSFYSDNTNTCTEELRWYEFHLFETNFDQYLIKWIYMFKSKFLLYKRKVISYHMNEKLWV